MINLIFEVNTQINELERFYNVKAQHLTENSQYHKIKAINYFFEIIGYKSVNEITENDIQLYLKSDRFSKLTNSSKKSYTIQLKTFLKFYKRNDLLEFIQNYKVKESELNMNDLITREDLEILLKSCTMIAHKTLIMMLYESATRKDEIINVKKKDVKFMDNYVNLYIEVSKTKKRNLPLVESIPYIREYFNNILMNDEDRIFPYQEDYVYILLRRIQMKAKKLYGFNKNIHPHLFRHSRLTELASNNKLNEPQLRKFAGWTKNSNMASVYFHLDDTNIKNTLLEQTGEIEKKDIKIQPMEKCTICNAENNTFNAFCWKCGNIINKEEAEKIAFEKAKEKEEFDILKQENSELKSKLNILQEQMKNVYQLVNKKLKLTFKPGTNPRPVKSEDSETTFENKTFKPINPKKI